MARFTAKRRTCWRCKANLEARHIPGVGWRLPPHTQITVTVFEGEGKGWRREEVAFCPGHADPAALLVMWDSLAEGGKMK